MPNTNILRIWSHVRQIGPQSDNAAGSAWFSLNLAPIFVSDPTAATGVDLALATKYLQPWTWQWTSKLRMALLRGGAVIGLIDIPNTIGAGAQIVTDNVNAGVSGVFADEFAHTAAKFNADCFCEAAAGINSAIQMSDDDSTRDWRTWILHASTYPGNIPLRGGVAIFFNVPYTQLNNADEIVVAPVFENAPFSAALAPVDPPLSTATPPSPCSNLANPVPGTCPMMRLKPNLNPFAAGDQDWVTQWNYAAPAGTDLRAEWIQTSTPLRIPPTPSNPWKNDGFIDERTLWITPSASSWKQDVNWHDQLEQRLSGLFDLPLRLLEWADKSLAQPPVSIDPNFGQALLATMRDLMRACGDSGTSQNLNRPDGGNLAADIAAVIAPGAANAAARAQILTNVTAYYAGFNSYPAWRQRLTDALAASGRFTSAQLQLGFENPVQTNGNYNDWLKLIHSMRAWLFDPVNLRGFIETDWQKALNDPTLQGALADVDQFLGNLDLLSVLRQGFMGVAWGKQSGSWYAADQVTSNMTSALINVYRDRLGLPDPPPPPGTPARTPWDYKNLLPRQDGVTGHQQSGPTGIEAYLASFISNWSGSRTGPVPANPPGSPPSSEPTPDFSVGNQGINVQLTNADTFGGDDQAFLGSFRGAAVLMRPSGNDSQGNPIFPWSMLNLGQYSLRGDGTDPKKQVAPPLNMDQVVVSPTQIIYRNGLRQVTITYRNQPLSARSPAAALSQKRAMKSDTDFRDGLFQLWNPYRDASPFRLPRLVFGLTYDIAATAIGLAGEMAKEISDPAKPWLVSTTPATWAPPAGKILTTGPYLRTVPVGLVRVEGPKSRNNTPISTMSGPPIPASVYPMVRSLQTIDSQKDTVILLADTNNVAGVKPAGSWITSATNTMQFFIRPPAVDLATFDSWPISPAPSLNDRSAIYSLIAQNTDILNTGDSSLSPDLTLDDPSVTSFSLTLTQVPIPGIPQLPAVPPKTFPVCRPAVGQSTLLQQYQSTHIPVTVNVGPAALQAPATCTDPQQVTVTVPPGTVFQLDITPVVDNPNVNPPVKNSSFFMPGALKLAPRTFFIEVASALNVPSLNDAATALNTSLQLALASPASAVDTNDQLQVSLDVGALATGTPAANLAPQIHRVELMAQRWRWQGRPLVRNDQQGKPTLFDFPYTDIKNGGAGSADTVLTPLDGVYFGERESNDQLIVVGQVDAVANPAGVPVLYTYDLTHSPQGLYYRFAIRVFSRYEGLFTRGASVESRVLRSASPQTGPSTAPEQWRRLLPLCRRTAKAPKPSVRLIIPLTRTVSGQQTPGLMVVLNEPWYEWAGLAERFEVTIASVSVPQGLGGGTKLQAGPDPVVSNPDFGAAGAPAPVNFEPNPPAIGPVGFTFDTNTNAPLFSSTSFIVPAPRQINPDGSLTPLELSWYFVQLQFRRTLNPDGTQNYSQQLDSDPTAPLQAQFLPAANLWNVTIKDTQGRITQDRLDTSIMHATSSAGAGISLVDSRSNEITVNPLPFDATSTNRFEVWALLTVELQDAFGHPGQEAFLTMVPFAALATQLLSAATSLRLVEIQAMTPLSPVRTDWAALADDLFPPANSGSATDPSMARARIIRVSPPISISS